MITADTPCLPDVVVKKKFPLLSLFRYLFNMVSRYMTRSTCGNILCNTLTGDLSVVSGNQTSFGLCHDSVNSLHSVKAIQRK